MGVSKLATILVVLALATPAMASDDAAAPAPRSPRHAIGGAVTAALWMDGFDSLVLSNRSVGGMSSRVTLVPGLSLRYDRVLNRRTALRVSVSGEYSSTSEDPSRWSGEGLREIRVGGVALAVGPRLRYDVTPRLRVGGEQLARFAFGAYGEHLSQPDLPEALDAEGDGYADTGRSVGTAWTIGTTTSVAAEVRVVDGFWFGMGASLATIGYERNSGEYRDTQAQYEDFEVVEPGDTETHETSGKSFVLTGPSSVAVTLTFEW